MSIKQSFHKALIAAATPAIYTILFVILMGMWKLFNLPNSEKTYELILEFFANYGLFAVAIAALLEGIVLINLYIPGSAAILLGVVTYHNEPFKILLIILIAIAAFIISSQINYFAGRYGVRSLINKLGGKKWLEKSEMWYKRYGKKALMVAYIHPNLGSFFAVTAGTAKLKWREFLTSVSLAIIVWSFFWGFIAYISAQSVREFVTSPELILVVLLSWTLVAGTVGA